MTPDWSANPTSIPYASLPYPQSLNLYSYVQNSPLSKTDPNGHCAVDGEHHSWLWCAGHVFGFTETQKELHADADRFRKTFGWIPGVKNMSDKDALNSISEIELGISMSMPDTPAGEVGAEAETATQAGTPRAIVGGVPQPNPAGEIIVGPNGTAIKIPPGYVAEPARPDGIVYRPAGSTGNANTIRVMGANANQGPRVIVYNASGQPDVPSTGLPGPAAQTHTSLN